MSAIDYVNYPLLKCIHANVNREKMPSPSVEIAVTGVQNRRILSGLLLSRLAAKNKAKNETARIQNKGEKRLSRKPPATAAKPVALELLIGQRAETSPASRGTNIAATALRTPRRVVTGLPPGSLRSVFYSESGSFDGSLLKTVSSGNSDPPNSGNSEPSKDSHKR
jgi:hypothetical protein